MKRAIAIWIVAATLGLTVLAADNVPTSSEQLTAAKQVLDELRLRYKDKHPRVQAQLSLIENLERVMTAQQAAEPAELRAARAELVELRDRYELQVRKVAELERQAAQKSAESPELIAARQQFLMIQQRYKEHHPKYQEALHRVEELEKQEKR